MTTLPTRPAAYWAPEDSLSHVYYLRDSGEWWHGSYACVIDPADLPAGLQHLGDYKNGQPS